MVIKLLIEIILNQKKLSFANVWGSFKMKIWRKKAISEMNKDAKSGNHFFIVDWMTVSTIDHTLIQKVKLTFRQLLNLETEE